MIFDVETGKRLITWSRRGGYEVTTKGDTRFSPLIITLEDGRTIEEHYHCDVKGYDPGGTGWEKYKGKPPLLKKTREEMYAEFKALYMGWALQNVELMHELLVLAKQHNYMLSDRFATSDLNQARALSEILNERFL